MSRVSFVGPSIGTRAAEPDFPFAALDGRALIYVSLGTVNDRDPTFFRAAVAAYQQMACQVVMSIGRHVAIADLGEIGENFIVRPHVPQLTVLKRAAVFINHAGMNSVQEALWHGVPLITVPQSPEQTVTARRIAQLGAGAMLARNRVTPQRLRALTERVLAEQRYRRNAQRLRDEIRKTDGHRRAAQEILAATRGGSQEES